MHVHLNHVGMMTTQDPLKKLLSMRMVEGEGKLYLVIMKMRMIRRKMVKMTKLFQMMVNIVMRMMTTTNVVMMMRMIVMAVTLMMLW